MGKKKKTPVAAEVDVQASVASTEVLVVSIEDITEYNKNPRIHEDTQVQKVANSIKKYGFVAPIIVDENNVIVAGHGRYAAAKLLGLSEVPVVRKSFPPGGAEAYRIADNELTDQSSWDMEILREEVLNLINEFQYTPEDVTFNLGFTTDDLDVLLSPLPTHEDLEAAEFPKEKKAHPEVDPGVDLGSSDEVIFLFFETRKEWAECFHLLGGRGGAVNQSVKQRTLKITDEMMVRLRALV
jgi:hypothetical protein